MTDSIAQLISDNLPDPAVAVDHRDRVRWMNKAFSAMAPAARTGTPIRSIIADSTGDLSQTLATARLSTMPVPFRAILVGDPPVTLLGEHCRLKGTAEPIVLLRFVDTDAQPSQFLMLTETIEELNREIHSRQRAETSLRDTVLKLEDANRTKERILAEVSHDLRTPLNAIIGFSDAMAHGLGGPLKPRQSEYIDLIRTSGLTLLDLVNQILDVASSDSQTDRVIDQLVNLRDCLSQCVSTVATASQKKYLTFLIPDDAQLPHLLVEQAVVMTVLMNLIDNAAKYSPEGGEIAVRSERHSDGALSLRIVDQGAGIPANQLDKITLPFYRVNPSHLSGPSGFGLGLSVVERRLQSIGSSLDIKSAPGAGTEVTVSFPADLVQW
jgi:signal transduction histidine kinase